jgi:hypothetical protein
MSMMEVGGIETVVGEAEFGLRLCDRACCHCTHVVVELVVVSTLSIVKDETNLEAGSRERTDR